MKQIALFLLTVLLMLTALTGCTGGGTAGETLSPQPSEESVQDAAVSDTPENSPAAEQEEIPPEESAVQTAFDTVVLEVERGTMSVRAGDTFSYSREDGGPADYALADGTLTIHQSQDHKTVLTLPERVYAKCSITVGEGHLYVECSLSLQELELSVTRGEASLSSVSVTGSSTITVSQGSASLSGDPGAQVTAHSSMGHLAMAVSGAQSSYNISFELSEGNIQLGEDTYHGLSLSKEFNNGAERSMTLTCSKGDLSIGFGLAE